MSKPAVFLDKDGTVNVNVPYNVDPTKITLLPGVGEGLKRLKEAGFDLIMITNQAGIAYGYFAESALDAVQSKLQALLAEHDVLLSGFYFCPHHPQGKVPDYACACECRKPKPGLIEQAAREHDIDMARSWFIGDILDDIEAGKRAGCRTVLMDAGSETEWLLATERIPDYLARNMVEAAELIVANSQQKVPVSCPSGSTT